MPNNMRFPVRHAVSFRPKISIGALLLGLLFSAIAVADAKVPLVEDGEAKAVIVLPKKATELQRTAAADFVRQVQRATGAELAIQTAGAGKPPAGHARIVLGPSAATRELGIADDLKAEEFRILTKDKDLIILARDRTGRGSNNVWGHRRAEDSRVTQWAFGYLLDRHLGVRWLWPGELGTHVPKQDHFILPQLDVRFQQPLFNREFSPAKPNPELVTWLGYHHFTGSRRSRPVQHAFRKNFMNGDWRADFLDTRPELLAESPTGTRELRVAKKPGFYKICVSHPGSAEEVLRRWRAKGRPDYWDVSPNDGSGFCTCDGCRKIDREFGKVEYSRKDIWRRPDHVNLTERYVWFWNKLLTEMRAENPNAQIGVYLYGAFREPPVHQKIHPGVYGLMVRDFDFKAWKAWADAGVDEIGLRPNWLYMGGNAPTLELQEIGSYIQQARAQKMAVFRPDCMHEYWATQGPLYYLMGRLVARPDLGMEEIIDEYCDAFGEAAPQVKRYLETWEAYHQKVIYNIPAGGSMRRDPEGLYWKVCHEHFGGLMHPLKGHWRTLPHLYGAEVMAPARAILDEASGATEDETVRRRIDFLRDGLRMVEHSAAYADAFNRKDESAKTKALAAHRAFNKAMREKHGYWNSLDLFFMKYWGLIGEEVVMSDGQ